MSELFKFKLGATDGGLRLDEFLAARLTGLSRMRIANLLSKGACLVNSQAARAGLHLREGDQIEIDVAEGPPTSMTPEPIPLEIVHEDDHLLVLVKAAGMLVHPTLGVKHGTLANGLSFYLNRARIEEGGYVGADLQDDEEAQPSVLRPGIVHRLDRATSGLMVIAKTQRALSVLTRHFHRRAVEKRYAAIVHGSIDGDGGSIEAPIGRDPERRPRWWVMESGRAASTRFRVKQRLANATAIELEPLTGRTNQLRIHCAYIGHPIIGDELYSSHEPALDQTSGRVPQAALRLLLHAHHLAFHHPADGRWMEFGSDPPEEMMSALGESLTCWSFP